MVLARRLWFAFALPISLLIIMLVSPAAAQSAAELASARAAANAGVEAYESGRWEEAIDYFERAEAIVHSPVHLVFMARAQIELGQLFQARENLLKVRREGVPEGASKFVTDTVQSGIKELEVLDPRVPFVTVNVEGLKEEAPFRVFLDGDPIPPTLVGIPYPVNPGDHKFKAIANGFESSEVSLTVQEGKKDEVLILQMRPSKRARISPAEPAESQKPSTGPVSGSAQSSTVDQGTQVNPTLRIASYAALGVGVVGLAVGTLFALQSKSRADEADELCGGDREACFVDAGSADAQKILDLNSDVSSARTLSIVGFAAGGVGVAAGVTLFVLSSTSGSSSAKKRQSPSITPWIGYKSLGIRGEF